MKRRKTDYGTVILHWVLVAAFGVALLSGLRIATEAPGRTWINLFDVVLPRDKAWISHMQAAVVLVAVSVAYAIYVIRAGLGRRVRLDKVRLRGLLGRGQARRGAVNVLLYWIFFIAMLSLIVSGGLLYFGYHAGHDVAVLHWYCTWAILAFIGLHVVTHYAVGGASQLLRIFRPTRLSAAPPPLDPAELLTLLVEQSARLSREKEAANERSSAPHPHPQPVRQPEGLDRDGATKTAPVPPRQSGAARSAGTSKARHPAIGSNPFVVAAAIAIVGATGIVAVDREMVDSVRVHRIARADAPVLDGDTSDRVWRNIKPFSVMTGQGGNFDGTGETKIDIRAAHDGTWAYFLFTWDDPTRSLKQLPLIKKSDGWHLLHNGYESGDEHDYNEDKFSVLLTTADTTLAGGRTFHAGPQPIPGAPATMTGRGLHYTEEGSNTVDVWQWKATSSATGWMDDAHIGPPLSATPMQARGSVPYKGGYAPDPGEANYSDNFVMKAEAAKGGDRAIMPRRLPTNLATTTAAMGQIDIDPNRGESEGARWFMTEAESTPYSPQLDARIPTGTIIPGVIVAGEFSGDRADVRSAARWASGHWALEVARRLDTHSQYDVPIRTGVFMRVAAFDHSQIRHTRHVRPIRLDVE